MEKYELNQRYMIEVKRLPDANDDESSYAIDDNQADAKDESEHDSTHILENASILPPDFLTPENFSEWFSLPTQDRRLLRNRNSLKQLNWPKDHQDEIAFNEMILAKLRKEPEFFMVLDNEISSLHNGRKKETKKFTSQLYNAATKEIPRDYIKRLKLEKKDVRLGFYEYLEENDANRVEVYAWFCALYKLYQETAIKTDENKAHLRQKSNGLRGEDLALLGDRLDSLLNEEAHEMSVADADNFWREFTEFGQKIGHNLSAKIADSFTDEMTKLRDELTKAQAASHPNDAKEIGKILTALGNHPGAYEINILRICRNEVSDLLKSIRDLSEIEASINDTKRKIDAAGEARDFAKEENLERELKSWKNERIHYVANITESLNELKERLLPILTTPTLSEPNQPHAGEITAAPVSQDYAELLRLSEDETHRLQQTIDQLREENRKLQYKLSSLKPEIRQSGGEDSTPLIYPSGISESELNEFCRQYLGGKVELQPNALNFPKKSVYKSPDTLYKALLLLRDYYYPMNIQGGAGGGKDLRKEWKDAYQNLHLVEKNSPFDKQYPNERLLQNSRNHEPETGLNIYFTWDDERQCVLVRSLPINLTL
ncbi:MAG: hypothetical protein QM537_09835 [Candidatus Symbiobacter sp.]|nr:hypothetical protein [Candidatus Symbiobacter sp.]